MSQWRSEKALRLAAFVLIALAFASLSFGVALAQGGNNAGAGLFSTTISLACSVIFFVVDLILLVWVYQDANKRGTNGCLWAIVVFFLSWIGLILYILLRPKNTIA